MTIPAIGGITSALSSVSTSALSSLNSAASTATTGAAAGAAAVSAPTGPLGPTTAGQVSQAGQSTGSDFASMLNKGIDAVQSAQSNADNLAVQAATGDLTNIHDYTIAATQASLMTELATAIRTKGVDAFNQIMGMQA